MGRRLRDQPPPNEDVPGLGLLFRNQLEVVLKDGLDRPARVRGDRAAGRFLAAERKPVAEIVLPVLGSPDEGRFPARQLDLVGPPCYGLAFVPEGVRPDLLEGVPPENRLRFRGRPVLSRHACALNPCSLAGG